MQPDRPARSAPAATDERYPGYDVLSKRRTPSWDEVTRAAVEARLRLPAAPPYLPEPAFNTLQALCERILPQPPSREAIPLAAYIDDKLRADRRDGYRHADLPPLREAWARGLAALEAEVQAAQGGRFADLDAFAQDRLIAAMQAGKLTSAAWGDMPCALFFSARVMKDIPAAYYAHPIAWNEIGFGGPASPRGYVRMDFDKRDPWEAAEARSGREAAAARANARVAG